MSWAASTTHAMQQIPPPQLPGGVPDLPATPTVIPRLPTRIQHPGRYAPLPDAVAIRPCPVPATSPPFDDEANDEGNGAVIHADGGRSDADWAAPDSGTPARGTPDRGTPDSGAPESRAPYTAAPRPVAPDGDESEKGPPGPPAGWPSQFAQVLAEALAGSRPARQLDPWTTEQTRKRIRQLGPMLATDQRPRVRRVMTSAPGDNVLEMTAVVGFGPRVRVLAVRLELEQPRAYRQGGSRWCCTAIESA